MSSSFISRSPPPPFSSFPSHHSLQCKEYGVFPCWYAIEEDKKVYIEKRKQLDQKRRQEKVDRTRVDQEVRIELREERYDLQTVKRTIANMGLQTERAYDSEIRYNQEMLKLQQRVKESQIRHEKKIHKQEEVMQEKIREETSRLNRILEENKRQNAEKYERDTLGQFYSLKAALGKDGSDTSNRGWSGRN